MPDPIIAEELDFPSNIVEVLKEELRVGLEGDINFVAGRVLRPSDPNRSVGIIAQTWRPEGHEIGLHEPAIQRYQLVVSSLIKNSHEETGVREHTQMARKIRHMLYRGQDLRLRLTSLSTTFEDESRVIKERVQRWGVREQRFLSNEIDGTFMYLTATEAWVETETV